MLTLREANLLACLFVRVSMLMFAFQDKRLNPFVPYDFVRDRAGGCCPAFGKEAPWIARETPPSPDARRGTRPNKPRE